jgi:hypothetical protein
MSQIDDWRGRDRRIGCLNIDRGVRGMLWVVVLKYGLYREPRADAWVNGWKSPPR